jgi:hypothetical protein
MNAIDLLEQQHEKTKRALKKMTEGAPANSSELRTLADELVAHMVIEEHIFYPRVKELMEGAIEESYEEHAVARFELARLIQSTGSSKKTCALVLKELLEHHVEEEETEMFSRVRNGIPEDELVRLGVEMKSAFDKAVEKGFAAFFPTAIPPRARKKASAGSVQARH